MSRESTGNLFGEPLDEKNGADPQQTRADAPLAERMRPHSIEQFVGQEHLIGEGRLVRRLIDQGGPLPSLILWGGPGTGKTTLARLLAGLSGARFVSLSAVLSGVKELREAIAMARKEGRRGTRTILFIDEIHRYNKAQQDALLQAVEDGTVTLLGATTENPSFEVIGALLSRTKVVALEPLELEDIVTILHRALADSQRGLASLRPDVSDEALKRLAAAGGDARVALTAIESAVLATNPGPDGVRRVQAAMLTEALGRARFGSDKQGEDHYNLISALVNKYAHPGIRVHRN
ncbi:MAG: AAA family ATPase [Isosphaeraceae bacterium]